MKSAIISTAAALSLASGSLAQTYTQSRPFKLVVQSTDKSVNNKILEACHEGAGIEGLCVENSEKLTSYNTYVFNTTSGTVVSDQNLGPTGLLIYELQADKTNGEKTPSSQYSPSNLTTLPESEPMQFFSDPSTNVALPLFEPTQTGQQVGFDKQNKLHVQSSLNDTVDPPTSTKVRGLYRWYVCKTNFEGYVYETLAWVLGNGKPENPTCKKVDVIRQFEA
ncbi:hypothetical protein PRZ48_009679 [Zasmidium cellare]|uniref:DUF7907 domain-containing protein n=1 Tax=Zasmidium cellare TaxID=395010 RepID=A0ABR0ECH3_ZASCE|nr:hypothetical protein PRZ48_009679 [Zasmidium cellare]